MMQGENMIVAQGGNMVVAQGRNMVVAQGENMVVALGGNMVGVRGGNIVVAWLHHCGTEVTYITSLSLTCNSDAYLSHHF